MGHYYWAYPGARDQALDERVLEVHVDRRRRRADLRPNLPGQYGGTLAVLTRYCKGYSRVANAVLTRYSMGTP